ncbi:MAG: MFS transporter [Actinomycetia bacterium]|nr:MFS transporter [Actinomycetes bacterium]
MEPDQRERHRGEGHRGWAGVATLGILTITTYGSWFYGFGVLIGPIHDDVGWSTTLLGLTYGAAQVITGLGSFVGGRLLDRYGGTGPFGAQAVFGGGLLLAATWADRPALFAVLYAAGAGITGATGFYHVTTAAAARLRADRPDKAIAVLTVIGALCSPIYLPLTAWMVTVWHWRSAARVLALVAIAGALLALTLARGGASLTQDGPSHSPLAALRGALERQSVRRMLSVYFAAGIAFSSVLVYQVPILTGAGITLGTAGAIGGLRGFCQIFGRVGLTGAVERFGAGTLLRTAYLGSAAGVALLLVGTIPAGIAYGLIAGAALGASSPLQAIYARQHFDEADLGLLMGLQGAAMGVAGGVGPLVGGVLNDWTDRWSPTIVMATGTLLLAAYLLSRSSRPEPAPN